MEFIRFHSKCHVRELGKGEIRAHLSSQATEKDGAASTQNVALSALHFLYRRMLGYAMAAGVVLPEDYRYMRISQNSTSTHSGEEAFK